MKKKEFDFTNFDPTDPKVRARWNSREHPDYSNPKTLPVGKTITQSLPNKEYIPVLQEGKNIVQAFKLAQQRAKVAKQFAEKRAADTVLEQAADEERYKQTLWQQDKVKESEETYKADRNNLIMTIADAFATRKYGKPSPEMEERDRLNNTNNVGELQDLWDQYYFQVYDMIKSNPTEFPDDKLLELAQEIQLDNKSKPVKSIEDLFKRGGPVTMDKLRSMQAYLAAQDTAAKLSKENAELWKGIKKSTDIEQSMIGANNVNAGKGAPGKGAVKTTAVSGQRLPQGLQVFADTGTVPDNPNKQWQLALKEKLITNAAYKDIWAQDALQPGFAKAWREEFLVPMLHEWREDVHQKLYQKQDIPGEKPIMTEEQMRELGFNDAEIAKAKRGRILAGSTRKGRKFNLRDQYDFAKEYKVDPEADELTFRPSKELQEMSQRYRDMIAERKAFLEETNAKYGGEDKPWSDYKDTQKITVLSHRIEDMRKRTNDQYEREIAEFEKSLPEVHRYLKAQGIDALIRRRMKEAQEKGLAPGSSAFVQELAPTVAEEL